MSKVMKAPKIEKKKAVKKPLVKKAKKAIKKKLY